MVQGLLSTWDPHIDRILEKNGVELSIQREDTMDALVSGNKIYKLKSHLKKFQATDQRRLLTFGGAYSNHIAATAAICEEYDIPSIGVIRGERPSELNPTLRRAEQQGMKLHFISRHDYKRKEDPSFIEELHVRFDGPYIIPEGGADLLGVEGAQEMIHPSTRNFDALIVCMGTGTTAAGLAIAASPHQRLIGIPIHKHATVLQEFIDRHPSLDGIKGRMEIHPYHLGGYAKWDQEHLSFIQDFYQNFGIPLDPIYTSKGMRCTLEMIDRGEFDRGDRILFIHTGGLQAVEGFEKRHGVRLFD